MELIRVTAENIENEHICCAISNNKDCQVASKKAWLSERFDDGLVFLKGNVRGKCFIEYIPAEKAWVPVEADNYTYIDCLWVAGQFKGHGYSSLLLDSCIEDSRAAGRSGLVILSARKKMPFLSDPKYLEYKGFVKADTAEPHYVLYCLPFSADADKPRFRDCVRKPLVNDDGYVIYYSPQCPYTAKYVPILAELAARENVRLHTVLFDFACAAQSSPSPYTAFSLFYNGRFITNEIPSENKFMKMLEAVGR